MSNSMCPSNPLRCLQLDNPLMSTLATYSSGFEKIAVFCPAWAL